MLCRLLVLSRSIDQPGNELFDAQGDQNQQVVKCDQRPAQLMDNAAKHANPSRVSVTLQLEDQMVRAIVEDDGVGFDSERVLAEADARKTIGIATMMDRVRMLGGDLDFESAPGRGTRATLQVPET